MKRWKITIEYDGRPYAGFQVQPNILTVQEEIETAIGKFCNQEISLTVAGRTDSGVHAYGQIAHFDLDYTTSNGEGRKFTGFEIAKAINAYLIHAPVSIIDAQEVSNDFHARFDAKEKLYSYRIINRPYGLALDQGRAWWRKRVLDVDAMNEAAQIFVGEHDFTSFRDTECQAKSPIRTLDKIWVKSKEILNGQEIFVHVRAQSFLHHQVRNIVGTLTLVGEGKWIADDIRSALKAKDRQAGGPTAPADGLYLVSIDYS